jgi:hypothetical protein
LRTETKENKVNRGPRSLRKQWENKLVRFGLSRLQIALAQNLQRGAVPASNNQDGIQQNQFDDGVDTWRWKKRVRNLTRPELFYMERIPCAYYAREVPAWTQNDIEVRKFIQHSHPSCKSSRRSARRAARLAYLIYSYFRLLASVAEIAEQLGIARESVVLQIGSVKKHAEIFFGEPQHWKICCRRFNTGTTVHTGGGPKRKIDYELAAKMRHDGHTYQRIGEHFGVSCAAVHTALKRYRPVSPDAHFGEELR